MELNTACLGGNQWKSDFALCPAQWPVKTQVQPTVQYVTVAILCHEYLFYYSNCRLGD